MPNTHYYGLIGDGHLRGVADSTNPAGPRTIDPLLGQYLQFGSVPSPALAVNQIVRSTAAFPTGSGCWGRVIEVTTADSCVIESFDHPTFGVPGGAFKAGEGITIDSGATTTMGLAGSQQRYPLRQQFNAELLDAELNTFTPPDRSDTPWFDPGAKRARQIVLTGASVAGDMFFTKGERCTTPGGAFTILEAAVDGSDYRIWIINATGTFSPSDVVTNAHAETGTILTVEADPPQGAWVAHHVMPNHNGLPDDIWEYPPTGSAAGQSGFGPTPQDKLIRRSFDKHVAAEDVTDRGVRWVPMSTNREIASAYRFVGGVTLQTVVCTGTFPTTWTPGEIVTAVSGWIGTVHGYDAANKFLYVRSTNGVTLGAETVTGTTSGATAASIGPAYGWAKGSAYYQAWLDRVAQADGAEGALFSGQARIWDGLALFIWEADANMFAPGTLAWPSEAQIIEGWLALFASLRADMGRADLPIAVWQPHPLQKADTVNFLGVPYAYYLNFVMEKLPAQDPRVRLVRSGDLEGATDATGSYPTAFLYLRPQDYHTLGERAWRSLLLQNITVPVGNFEVMPVVVFVGQSQQVGTINATAMMAADRDPELYPSASFPGVNTLDANVLRWNTVTLAWEPYDVASNGNTFFGITPGTVGPDLAVMQRMKRRFDQDASETDVSRIGSIKLAVNGSSANANSRWAPATWDPAMTARVTFDDTMTVAALPATSMLPQRGRFIAPADTFSTVNAGDAMSVAGSVLGTLGYGGNNTATYATVNVVQVAGDGSWVELAGAFVNEGALPLSLAHGPVPIAPLAEEQIRLAITAAATELRAIAIPTLLIWENGESDLALVDEYKAALLRVFEWLQRILGGRIKGQASIPKAVVQLSSQTPWPVPDADVTQMRAIQAEVADELENCVLVDPSQCPQESSGVWPITSRLDHGIHRTARGHIMAGYLIDAAAGSLEGIPEHPDGAAALDFGSDGGGSSNPGGGTDGPETDAPGDLVVEDGSGMADAESLASVAFADLFWERNGSPTWWDAATLVQKEVWLRAATREWVMPVCAPRLRGGIMHRTQRLCFPRLGCVDDDGRLVEPGTVPDFIMEATALVAGEIGAGRQPLANEVDRGTITRETKKGAGFEKTVEYAQGASSSSGASVRMRKAEALVYPYLRGGGPGVARS